MSGPIVRKYGFPNFEKIFGQRPLLHGTEDETAESARGSDPKDRPEESPGRDPEPPKPAE